MMILIAQTVSSCVIVLGLAQVLINLVQLLQAARALAESPPDMEIGAAWRISGHDALPIAILAPAFNEAKTIEQSVRSLLSLKYPHFEIIIINDGSADATLAVLTRAFGLQRAEQDCPFTLHHAPVRAVYKAPLHPNLTVIDKENGGKADALNAGINFARSPLFCSMDADSILEPDALLGAVQPFIEDPARVVATGGTVRISNGCVVRDGRVVEQRPPGNLLALIQSVEYMRAFLLARLALSRLGALMIVSGAFGLFKRQAVIDAGGYLVGTVGEDMELIVRLHRYNLDRHRDYRIVFTPEPICWTEVPESLDVLARQRARWQRGALETFARHGEMLFARRYGRVGAIGLGQVALVDVLGPLAELIGVLTIPVFVLTGLVSVDYALAFLVVTVVFGVSLSVGALVLEQSELRRLPRMRDLLTLGLAAIIENFGYRQLNTLWRAQGLWQWLRKERAWGAMPRKGFG